MAGSCRPDTWVLTAWLAVADLTLEFWQHGWQLLTWHLSFDSMAGSCWPDTWVLTAWLAVADLTLEFWQHGWQLPTWHLSFDSMAGRHQTDPNVVCCFFSFFNSAGCTWSLKIFESLGKMEYTFQGLESLKTEWGLWKFVNFVVFRALGKICQVISHKLHFPRLNSSFFVLFFNYCAKLQRMHFLSVWLIEYFSHWLQ